LLEKVSLILPGMEHWTLTDKYRLSLCSKDWCFYSLLNWLSLPSVGIDP